MYIHVQGMLLLLVSGHVYGRLCALLTLDECDVVSWSDKCTYDCVLYRMVRLLFTLSAGKEMDQLLNYYIVLQVMIIHCQPSNLHSLYMQLV